MIIEDIRTQIKEAMKAKLSAKVALLRLIIGTVQQDGDESDAAVEKVIRKMIKNNNQTAEALVDNNKDDTDIRQENILLESFLPKTMSVEDIQQYIKDNNIDINGHEGKAIGMVIKAIKAAGLNAQGNDVKSAVASLKV